MLKFNPITGTLDHYEVGSVTSVNTRTGAVTGLAEASDLTAHTGNTSNPHSVTKAQVGLGNVDNTSDVSKPISTATQTALDGKFTQRTITGTTNQVTVTNGDGVSGNPTLSLPSAITTPGSLTITGNNSPQADSTYTLGTSSLYWSNTYTDRLYLNSTAYLDGGTAGAVGITGNVGIGTTSPGNALEIGTTTSTGNYIKILGSNSDGTYLVFSGARKYPKFELVDTFAGGSTFSFWNLGNTMRFGTNTGTSALAAWFTKAGNAADVIFNGNVGIGTTAPNEKLTVAGAISITDGITAPSATSGYAKIYVDTADGDLKVIFGDGTVKTIAMDT